MGNLLLLPFHLTKVYPVDTSAITTIDSSLTETFPTPF